MATLTEPRATAPYRLFADGARDYDVDPPEIGEAIMLRLPFAITLGPPSIISSGVTGANGANYHLCFVAGQVEVTGSVLLTVWVCLGFSSARLNGLTANSMVQSFSADWQACLLPLAFVPQIPSVPRLPSPALFGHALHIGGFLARKPCFLNIKTYAVTISNNAAFKRFSPPGYLSRAEMRQINRYTAISPAMHLDIGNREDHSSGSSPEPNPENPRNSASDTRATHSRPAQPPPPGSQNQPRKSSKWYQHIPELAEALHAAESNSGDDNSENEYTMLDYMRFLAPRQPPVQVALQKEIAADDRRLKQRVADWVRSVATL